MWIVFGISAIITAMINVAWTMKNRDARWFRFASLSLTALTMCAEMSLVKGWVLAGDTSALEDVVPGITTALWILVAASILINSISLFKQK